jgi:fumarylpyruvate hydrolase
MTYCFDPAPRPALKIAGSDRLFPVRRVWCVGRNYADHAREMGHDPRREPPFFFAKPGDAVTGERKLPFPSATSDLQHEVELAVALRAGGSDLPVSETRRLIFGYAVAIDLTRRDLQAEAKKLARPWDMAKGFDRSCPISSIQPSIGNLPGDDAVIDLSLNGAVRQQGRIGDMIWSIEECLSALSKLVELEAGDILLTGTPAGVGRIERGDELVARCSVTQTLSVRFE